MTKNKKRISSLTVLALLLASAGTTAPINLRSGSVAAAGVGLVATASIVAYKKSARVRKLVAHRHFKKVVGVLVAAIGVGGLAYWNKDALVACWPGNKVEDPESGSNPTGNPEGADAFSEGQIPRADQKREDDLANTLNGEKLTDPLTPQGPGAGDPEQLSGQQKDDSLFSLQSWIDWANDKGPKGIGEVLVVGLIFAAALEVVSCMSCAENSAP